MKKARNENITLVLLVVVILSLVLSLFSFAIFDSGKVDALKDVFSGDFSLFWNPSIIGADKLIFSEGLEGIREIRVKKLDTMVNIREGQNELKAFSNSKKTKFDEYVKYRVEDGILFLENRKDGFFNKINIEISLENLNDVVIVIEDLNGVLEIEDYLENLEIGSLDGVLTIDSIRGFDVKIDKLNGVMDWELEEKNLNVSIEKINGLSTIFGQSSIKHDDNSIHKSFGSSDYHLIIGKLDGVLDIE